MQKPKMRVIAYVRVSNREQVEGFSIEAQERAILAYCRAQDWEDPQFFRDLGKSGYTDVTAKRPEFARMLDEAVAGGCDVLIVHRLDRFSRSLMTTLRELKRLQMAGIGFVSVSEQMDFVSPIGRVFLAMLAALSEYYSSNLSTETKKGLNERRAQGFRPPKLPYGARLVGGVGPAIEVDPAKADALARVLEVAAAHSQDRAALVLTQEGIPSRHGAPWHGSSVKVVVRAAVWLLDQPAPWPERYRAAAERPKTMPTRGDRRVWMLSGLMRCTVCGGTLLQQARNGEAQPGGVQCYRGAGQPRRCLPGAPRKTNPTRYEEAVVAWVADLPSEVALLRAATRLTARDDPAMAELGALALKRQQIREEYEAQLIDRDTMIAEAAALLARERALAPRQPDVFRTAAHLGALRESFADLPPAAQNAALHAVVAEVRVTGPSAEIVPIEIVAALLAEARSSQVA